MLEIAGHVSTYSGINYDNIGMLGTERTRQSAARE
jgi:hypothetical protein